MRHWRGYMTAERSKTAIWKTLWTGDGLRKAKKRKSWPQQKKTRPVDRACFFPGKAGAGCTHSNRSLHSGRAAGRIHILDKFFHFLPVLERRITLHDGFLKKSGQGIEILLCFCIKFLRHGNHLAVFYLVWQIAGKTYGENAAKSSVCSPGIFRQLLPPPPNRF